VTNTRRIHLPSPAPVRRTNLTILILEQLRQYVIQHDLREEDRLPPERELAIRLQVSRPSLRNALEWLSENGAVRRVQGGGTFISADFLSVVAAHDRRRGDQPGLAVTAEARMKLEPILAGLAAQRATENELAVLQDELAGAQQRIGQADTWRRRDLQFHTRIARMAKNSVLSDALESLLSQVLEFWTSHSDQYDCRTLQADHRMIVEALVKHDPEAAAVAMRNHLRMFEQAVHSGHLKIRA